METNEIIVRVPATTANLGSGFDVLGLALSLENELHFIPEEGDFADVVMTAEGEGLATLAIASENIIFRAMEETAAVIGKPLPAGRMHAVNRIPFARGLGSSSAAIVSGIVLANALLGAPLSENEMLQIAAKVEGHPDNVAPALLGGFVVSMMEDGVCTSAKIPVADDWKAVVAIPDYELMTEEARAVLPTNYSRADAVHNVSAVSFLLTAFFTKNPAYLARGLSDCIHVPYRIGLIPGGEDVMENAKQAGAFGATISGSGSTMIAFADEAHAEAVGAAMQKAFAEKGMQSRVLVLDFNTSGASVETKNICFRKSWEKAIE